MITNTGYEGAKLADLYPAMNSGSNSTAAESVVDTTDAQAMDTSTEQVTTNTANKSSFAKWFVIGVAIFILFHLGRME